MPVGCDRTLSCLGVNDTWRFVVLLTTTKGIGKEDRQMTPDDEHDLHEFLDATAKAMAALMRVYERAAVLEDGLKMSTALRVQALLHDSDRVMAQICVDA